MSGTGNFEGDVAAVSFLGAGSGDNFNVAVECREEVHEPLYGIFPEMTLEEAGDLGLRDAHARTGLGLGEFAATGQTKEFGDDLRFEVMGIGIRQTKIGEDVGVALVDPGPGSVHRGLFPCFSLL